ncbi:hypothetical protein K9M74_05555 [Candidatus Woesearchaeota archaeon]|nr:hypothetical protein [Candidatus Woesearchaeota archaeon]
MAKKIDLHKYIGVFLIILGILPFLGANLGKTLGTIAAALTIVCGVVILLTK